MRPQTRAPLLVVICLLLLRLPDTVNCGPKPLTPATTTSVECLDQPYATLSGAFSLGKQQPDGPSMVFTLGASPLLYAIDVWGVHQTPLSLRTDKVAHTASANAQLSGAALYGDSLYLVFARNNDLGLSGILQIVQPWGGSPGFKYHPLGSVRVYDVVTGSKALYLLTQPKTVDSETNLMRFDLARGTLVGIRLPFSGGKLTLTVDERYILAAGPTRNVTSCSDKWWGGCSLAYTFDSANLRQVFSENYDLGGCGVYALAVGPAPHSLYMASSGGQYCDTWRQTGNLDVNNTWHFDSVTENLYSTANWAVASYNFWDGFLEGLGGLISTTATNLQFTLQTDQQVSFNSPMVVTDTSLGSCLVFPATACNEGTLSLYVFTLNQFSS